MTDKPTNPLRMPIVEKITYSETTYKEIIQNFEDLLYERILGYEEKDDFIYIFLGYADKYRILRVEGMTDGYRHEGWDLTMVDSYERTSNYKAIGERVYLVEEIDDKKESETYHLIKMPTKTIKIGEDYSDDYYPWSIWEVL